MVFRQFKYFVRRVKTCPILEKYQIIKKRRSIHDPHPKGWSTSLPLCCRCTRLHVMHIPIIRLNRLQSRSFHVSGCGEVVFFRLTTRGWTARDQRNTICEFFNWASLPFIAKFSYSIWSFFFFFSKLWEQLQSTHTHTSNPLLLHHGSDGKQCLWNTMKQVQSGVEFICMENCLVSCIEGSIWRVIYKNVFAQHVTTSSCIAIIMQNTLAG